MWPKLVVCLLLIIIPPLSYLAGSREGATRARGEEQARAAEALAQADKSYREQEKRYADQVEQLRVSYAVQDKKEDSRDAVAELGYSRGTQRLRLPVTTTRRCPEPTKVESPSPRADAPESAELAPEAAQTVYSIAADGDDAIRQLTALQAWVREALTLCNGGRPPDP